VTISVIDEGKVTERILVDVSRPGKGAHVYEVILIGIRVLQTTTTVDTTSTKTTKVTATSFEHVNNKASGERHLFSSRRVRGRVLAISGRTRRSSVVHKRLIESD